jgi:hypothetical protein
VFDLSSPFDVLQQVVFTLAAREFRVAFGGFRFMVAFLSEHPIFVTRKNNILSFSISKIFDSGSTFDFDVGEMESLLNESFPLVRKISAGKSASKDSFTELVDVVIRHPIQSLFLFHSIPLPIFVNPLPFCVNAIE